jgi:putative transposase
MNIKSSNPSFTVDDIYSAIAHGHLIFDLHEDRLAAPLRSHVYANEGALHIHRTLPTPAAAPVMTETSLRFEAGEKLLYEGQTYEMTLVGPTSSVLQHGERVVKMTNSALQELYLSGALRPLAPQNEGLPGDDLLVSPAQLERATARQDILELHDRGLPVPVSLRTIQRWKKAIRAGNTFTEQIVNLAPITKQGCFGLRLSDDVVEAMNVIRKRHYNKASGNSKIQAYRQFLSYCLENDIVPCSEKSFNKHIEDSSSLLKREGTRNAYKSQPITLYLDAKTPINGLRPFELVHIDHTPLEILIVNPERKEISKSVWLTLAIDAYSRAIVGFYLTTEPPSYVSCMMVLRTIVQKYGRMPDVLVVDNAKEFQSHALQRVCKLYRTNLRYRPKGKPRFGTVMERVLLTTQSELIHNLSGNTKLNKGHRNITKAVNPKQFVEWSLVALHGSLSMYFEELYGTHPHPAHGFPPVEMLRRSLEETGLRSHTLIRYDRVFRIETCPSVDNDTRVLDPIRGVKYKHYFYWCDAFRNPRIARKNLPVRRDPWDPRFCYTLIDGIWHTTRSKLIGELQRCSELELRHAVDETAKKYLRKGQNLTPELLNKWTHVAVAANFDERLRAESDELRKLYEGKGLGSVEQDIQDRHRVVVDEQKTGTSIAPMTSSKPAGVASATAKPFKTTTVEAEDDQFGYF